jgi:hypothetical protein
MVREAVVGSLADEVDRVVADVEEAESLVLDWSVGVSEDECDVDLAVAKATEVATRRREQ